MRKYVWYNRYGDNLKRIIFHIDVNNAFLSWTAVERLKQGDTIDLRTIPSVIGGDEAARKGVVLAKSPIAKSLGIVTAETLYQARRKCSNLVIVQSDYSIYKKYSDALYNYLCSFSPDIERYSIDECFLDMTGTDKLFGEPISLAHKMSKEIYETLGFTVNIGIGENKLCAKMASDFEKPNKVHTLFMDEVKSKMWPLPVNDLFMVGKKSSKLLNDFGIFTIGDLANADLNFLIRYFKARANMMKEYANGIDDSPVYQEEGQEGISNSETFDRDIDDILLLEEKLLELSEKVGFRLRSMNYYCYTISLLLKTSDFKMYSHQKKLDNPINTTHDIYEVSRKLLRSMWHEEKIRLMGLRVTNFTETRVKQLSLFDDDSTNFSNVQKVVDNLKNKYGMDVFINPSKIKNKDN